MSLSTPVVILIFNRPDLTKVVFEAIAKVKPKKLFVVADGPRFHDEVGKCEKARTIVERIDWECNLFTNFSDKNLGCGRRVATGIDWVFSKVEEAIFFEDDCLPAESFFFFCEELLERYRDDHRIMTIGGNNFQSEQKRSAYSYHFSKYSGCWGWASWRRAWEYFDYEMTTWPEFKQTGILEMVCKDTYEHKFWTKIFDSMYENSNQKDIWDYQWKYACWSQNGLAIEPSVNLVANLGLGRSDATHTTNRNPLLKQITKTQEIEEIKHPPFVVRHRAADAYVFNYIVGGKQMKKYALLDKLRNWIVTMREKVTWRATYDLKKKMTTSTLFLIEKIIRLFIPPIVFKCARAFKNVFQKPVLEYAPDGWQTPLNKRQEVKKIILKF